MKIFYGLRSKETKELIGVIRVEGDRDGFGEGYRLCVLEDVSDAQFFFVGRRAYLTNILTNENSFEGSTYTWPNFGLIDVKKLEIFEVDLNPDSCFVGRSRKHGQPAVISDEEN